MSVRPTAVAGSFYPADAKMLTAQVQDALSTCECGIVRGLPAPKAIMVPHAGYIYSGLTAAFAYALIKGAAFRRVVLLGPAHRVGFHGMALPEAKTFRTPLGDIPIDQDYAQRAMRHDDVHCSDVPHAEEHSLEVQLPFLQSVLSDFKLLPLCVGLVDPQAVSEVMELFLNDAETLTVVSSDLSHFHEYERAVAIDNTSLEVMLSGASLLSHEQACGATAVNALLIMARKYSLTSRLLDYRNSGDTAGDKQRVVGYTSMAWFEQEHLNE